MDFQIADKIQEIDRIRVFKLVHDGHGILTQIIKNGEKIGASF